MDSRKVIEAIRHCNLATMVQTKTGRVSDTTSERKCYSILFALLFDRKPTTDELDYMTGCRSEPPAT
jgi:hypothetical protein